MELTEHELEIAGHTLGVNVYHAKRSKLKRDKKLPKEFYRNYFCAGRNHLEPACLSLEGKGYMERWENYDGQIYFGVTETGIEAFKTAFTNAILSPSKTPEQ